MRAVFVKTSFRFSKVPVLKARQTVIKITIVIYNLPLKAMLQAGS